MSGEIEVDESYFGAKRVRGKRGRGAGKKTSVFLLRATHLQLCKKEQRHITGSNTAKTSLQMGEATLTE